MKRNGHTRWTEVLPVSTSINKESSTVSLGWQSERKGISYHKFAVLQSTNELLKRERSTIRNPQIELQGSPILATVKNGNVLNKSQDILLASVSNDNDDRNSNNASVIESDRLQPIPRFENTNLFVH